MESPLPSPRSNIGETKKPIPTPRQNVKPITKTSETTLKTEEHINTLTKRVSSASKQLAGDITQMVHDRKKAVIEGTRQSVRRIARRFSPASEGQNSGSTPPNNDEETIDFFSTIRFNSPISQGNNIYNNVDNDNASNSSEEDLIGLPPPTHPPPPLPQSVEESLYDAPTSLSPSVMSSSSENSTKNRPDPYESVFPLWNHTKNKDNANDSYYTASTSESWKFYDTISNEQNSNRSVYENIVEPLRESLQRKTSLEKSETAQNKSCDENSNLSVNSSMNFTNSLYENQEIMRRKPETHRASQSVILQFDPLNNMDTPDASGDSTYDMKLLEELLQGDLYGNISEAHTLDEWSISNDSDTEEISPPTPPIRVDSLPEEETESSNILRKSSSFKSKTNWFTSDQSAQTSNENRKISWFKNVLEKAPDVMRGMKNKDTMVERASLDAKTFVQKRGMLYKVQSGPVEDLFGEYSGRWCVLEKSNFVCYSDNTCQHLKEHFSAQNILSIQILQDQKYNYRYDNESLYCFEVNTTGKSRGGHIYGSKNSSERRIWMQLLAESLTNRFSSKLTTNFTRMGWTYIREGIAGKWIGAWIILSEREFCYVMDNHPVKKIDLRKARCIVLQPYRETDNNPRTNDRGPNIIIDSPDKVLYMRMWTSRETKVWCHIVKSEALNNGAYLNQQQITKNYVPVIVEKCINFIYAHGSMTEGIYRRPGSASAVADLLTKFRKDAFAVQLTVDQYSEHDVATALKRFFKDLPEPLLGSNQRQYFHEVSKHNNREEKIRMYRAALEQLPQISYNTAQKLFGHLHFISSQSAENLMSVENLASIWGPTLLFSEDKDGITNNVGHGHQRDTEVINQIISLYRYIFPEDPAELEKEKHMLKVLQKYTKSQSGMAKKTAGDLRIWISLHNKEGQSFNVSIGASKTAYDVCKELSGNIKLSVHELILEEIILNDKLIRPIHHQEKLLDVVLKWSYWDEQDRKDNCIVLVPLSKYWEYILDKPHPVSGELKFADSKSKSFKTHTFQFSQGKLTCFKDKSGETVLHSWNIEDIIWYLGHETRRNPQWRWTITFIEINSQPVRSKHSPFFGNVIVWADASLRASWLSAMLKSRYPNNLAPPPNFVAL